MCGICGLVALDGVLPALVREAVPDMCRALAHRGPDDQGVLLRPRVALGHRRLSIIDRAGGHQPLANEDGTCWIVFNGEIYNHHALRARLEGLGHVFRTKSDTEAIVHAWEQFGPSCVEWLEGMFAFAIVDTRTNDVFLARDRLGKKPLYYAVIDGVLCFGSEIKAIAQVPGFDPSPDPDSIKSFFLFGYTIGEATAYRSIRQLEAGHSLRVQNGKVQIRKYWDVTEFDTDHRSEGAVLDDVESRIRAAVSERLESEVPLGVFLSGGIDSGLVTAYMAESMERPVVATSVGFASAAHDELAAARLTARAVHAEHHTEIVDAPLEEAVGLVIGACDEPFADPSAIPTWHVSRMARRHVTVALSGDGGDESFAGYDFRYVPASIEAKFRDVLRGPAGRGVARAAAAVWPRGTWLPRPLRLGTLLDNVAVGPSQAYFNDLCFLKPQSAATLFGGTQNDVYQTQTFARVAAAFDRCSSKSPLQRVQYADLKLYLPTVLAKVDRMSMQHGLEVRSPLLDRRLIELAFRLPSSTKMPRLQPKHLLRQLAVRRLPAELSKLPKKGFSPPIGDWLAGKAGNDFRDEVLASTSRVRDWVDQAELARRFAVRHRKHAPDVHVLWSAWLMERWLATTRSLVPRAVMSQVSLVRAAHVHRFRHYRGVQCSRIPSRSHQLGCGAIGAAARSARCRRWIDRRHGGDRRRPPSAREAGVAIEPRVWLRTQPWLVRRQGGVGRLSRCGRHLGSEKARAPIGGRARGCELGVHGTQACWRIRRPRAADRYRGVVRRRRLRAASHLWQFHYCLERHAPANLARADRRLLNRTRDESVRRLGTVDADLGEPSRRGPARAARELPASRVEYQPAVGPDGPSADGHHRASISLSTGASASVADQAKGVGLPE